MRDKNKKEIGENKTIKEILNDKILPNYIHLSEETTDLFYRTNFTLFKLFSIYEYFELLCYDDFVNNTVNDYKEVITEDKLSKLNQHFKKKKKMEKDI